MTVVIAHRGASKTKPENTLEAFREAVRLGADWVELDVRRTKDGELAIHHDPKLADGRTIADLSAAELPASVPNLSDALGACEGIKVNIEIKNDPTESDFDETRSLVEPVMEVALALMNPADVLISSFDYPTVNRVRELQAASGADSSSAWLDTALLFWTEEDLADVVAEAVAGQHRSINAFDHLVTAELVKQAHDAGLEVNVWTVDDPGRMAELVGFGVDGIVTNDPETARQVVDGR